MPPASWKGRADRHRGWLGLAPVQRHEAAAERLEVKEEPELKDEPQVQVPQAEVLEAARATEAEEPDGDCWGLLNRVELPSYITWRSARLAHEALRDGRSVSEIPGLHSSGALALIIEAVAVERELLRHPDWSPTWPDVLRSPPCFEPAEALEVEQQLRKRVEDLEHRALHSDQETQAGLRAVPVLVALRHSLADFRLAAGDLAGACEALAAAVACEGDGKDPLSTPLAVGWDRSVDCPYVKAQQSLRFGHLALLAARDQAAQAAGAEAKYYTASLARLKKAAFTDAAKRGALTARRHLQAASKSYEELLKLEPTGSPEEPLWTLVLRCAHCQSLGMLAEARLLLEEGHAEAAKLLQMAIAEALAVQHEPLASARLARLLAREVARLRALADPLDG